MPIVIAGIVVILIGGALYFFTNQTAPSTLPVPASETAARPQDTTNEEVGMTMDENGVMPSDDQMDQSGPAPIAPSDDEYEQSSDIEVEAAAEVSITPPVVTPPAEQSQIQTLSASGNYLTPARTSHEVGVSMTLDGNIVTAVDVTYDGGDGYSNPNQERFDDAISGLVIGKSIDTLSLSRVGGASLTTNAFNEAVAKISAQL